SGRLPPCDAFAWHERSAALQRADPGAGRDGWNPRLRSRDLLNRRPCHSIGGVPRLNVLSLMLPATVGFLPAPPPEHVHEAHAHPCLPSRASLLHPIGPPGARFSVAYPFSVGVRGVMRARARSAGVAIVVCGVLPALCAGQTRLGLQYAVDTALRSRPSLKAD